MDEQLPEALPFQVQIRYKSLDGQQCLRVLTEARPLTSDIAVANQGIAMILIITRLGSEFNCFACSLAPFTSTLNTVQIIIIDTICL